MNENMSIHSFFIPVMGTAFSIDSPAKVAKYGISSVLSIGDDELCETMRKYYSELYQIPYSTIDKWDEDARARRITAYLDVLDIIIKQQIETLKKEDFSVQSDITKYFELLAPDSPLKQKYQQMLSETNNQRKTDLQNDLRKEIKAGSIDVNIMTKLDKINYDKTGNELPSEYSDALSAARGFAKSTAEGALVLSAGINMKLYAYIENLPEFQPDSQGHFRKRIVVKVSDYRSSVVQGKFFAKKGIWVNEFRVESGLNCGGHAFATDGYLLGPILEEFKNNKVALISELLSVYNRALKSKNLPELTAPYDVKLTVQGGIGTHNEDLFLRNYFKFDNTGWATPFLLVPEATTVDDDLLQELVKAEEKDLILSNFSPLGISFNALKNTPSEKQKEQRITSGSPGSPCPKRYLVFPTDVSKTPLCTASKTYQSHKIKDLQAQNLPEQEYQDKYNNIVAKVCLCEDLASTGLKKYHIDNKRPLMPAICPGPNLAYFSGVFSLKEMIEHIYGIKNLLNKKYRPNMFMKELGMYIDHFSNEIKKVLPQPNEKQIAYLQEFQKNMLDGIEYYKKLIPHFIEETFKKKEDVRNELQELITKFEGIIKKYQHILNLV